ncbi:MAG: hypothetical protein OXT65_08715 [Alphaproteobacteria bacterium]|nr:hypothetical protein [Alphaproteobacteria bacterium]
MTTWPATLPAPLSGRFREVPANTLVRTKMDQGPAKLRRRTTAGVSEMTASYLLSAAQTTALDAFYNDTTGGGSVAFDMAHPRSGATVSCRFVKPPEYSDAGNGYFYAQVELEVMP